MAFKALFAIIVLSSSIIGAPAEKASISDSDMKEVIGQIFAGSSMQTLREICDQFGPRLTGTPAYDDAAKWAVEQFRAAGLDDVHLETVILPNGWQRGGVQSHIYAPIHRPLQIQPIGWTPSTPQGGIKADLVELSDISVASIRVQADNIRGRIVLLNSERIFADGFSGSYSTLIASYPVLKEIGALALLFPDAVPNNVLGDWLDNDNGHAVVQLLPMAEIGMEDSKLLHGLLQRGPVTIGFGYTNQISGPIKVSNVIADIRGNEKPEEWILIGAHLDSWDLGTGAQDNATGVVMVIEAARALSKARAAPRRSIRFALWAAEEPGLVGSYSYVLAHESELPRYIAILNTDSGSGHPRGWRVEGRKDVHEALSPIAETFLEDLGGAGISDAVSYDSDYGPFMLKGIPALDLWTDQSQYDGIHHKPGDTFDKVDPLYLKADAAIVAVTAYVIAQLPLPLAQHLDHAAVGAIVKSAGLESYLFAHGIWNP